MEFNFTGKRKDVKLFNITSYNGGNFYKFSIGMNDSRVLLALNIIVFNHMHCFNECIASYGLVDISLKYGLNIHLVTFNLFHCQVVNLLPSSQVWLTMMYKSVYHKQIC